LSFEFSRVSIGNRHTNKNEWASIKVTAKKNAVQIVSTLTTEQKSAVTSVSKSFQHITNQGGISNTQLHALVRQLNHVGISAKDASCLMKNIMIITRHSGDTNNLDQTKDVAPTTKMNIFGMTRKTNALTAFLTECKSNKLNNNHTEYVENSDFIDDTALAVLNTIVCNVYHMQEESGQGAISENIHQYLIKNADEKRFFNDRELIVKSIFKNPNVRLDTKFKLAYHISNNCTKKIKESCSSILGDFKSGHDLLKKCNNTKSKLVTVTPEDGTGNQVSIEFKNPANTGSYKNQLNESYKELNLQYSEVLAKKSLIFKNTNYMALTSLCIRPKNAEEVKELQTVLSSVGKNLSKLKQLDLYNTEQIITFLKHIENLQSKYAFNVPYKDEDDSDSNQSIQEQKFNSTQSSSNHWF
jgi:hypothetical protein